MSDAGRRKGLGRGLAALIDDIRTGPEEGAAPAPVATAPIELIRPNPDQPRKSFDDVELDALAASIRERGVIQPLIVRADPGRPGAWQIVAGERRWRAAQRAQLHELPIVVRAFTDAEVIEIAILENVQRADLNPMEEAAGYAALIDRFGHGQEQIAKAMGRSRSHVANALRLLTLAPDVQALVREGALSAGHARALVGAPDALALARTAVDRGLSVRDTEALVKTAAAKAAAGGRARRSAGRDADTRSLEADLSAALGLTVSIRHRSGQDGGVVAIAYRDLDQLDGLCQALMR
jgi:ParB family chromosome partitioning protein